MASYDNNQRARGRHAKPRDIDSLPSIDNESLSSQPKVAGDAAVPSSASTAAGGATGFSYSMPKTEAFSVESSHSASGSGADADLSFGEFDPNAVSRGAGEAGKYAASNYGSGSAKRGGNARSGGNSNLVKVRRKKHKSRVGLYVVLAVLAVVLVGGGVAGFSLYNSAKSMQVQANAIMSDVNDVQSSITAGDYTAAQSSARKVKDQSDKLCNELSSPLWSAATLIPVYGQDVKSVITVASVLQDASGNALVPLTDALVKTPPNSLVSSDGSINIASVESLLGSLESAAPVMQRCADQMDSLPPMHVDKLSGVVTKATDKLDTINDAFQQANAFAPVIGSILGGNGQRTYLIAAQNSAEIRSAGGFPGSCGTLVVDNGKISLGDFSSVWDVMDKTLPSGITLTDEELSIFERYFIEAPRDEEVNADFPRVAEIWAASFSETTGTKVDGVISMTPAIIQDLLSIVGPVTLSDGTVLNGSNATKALQHDLYWKYLSGEATSEGNEIADALFAETADLAFEKALGNMSASTITKLAGVLADSFTNRTLMMWMKDPAEQEHVVAAGCSGALGSDKMHPEIGVYFCDWTVSKLGWYLDMDTSVIKQSEKADGSATYQVQVKLTNTVTAEEAETGGWYIMGTSPFQDIPGQMISYVYLYAPAGGTMSDVHASNGASFSTSTYKGLPVSFTNTKLNPSESILLTYTVTTAPGEQADLAVSSTPTLTKYR